MTWFCALQKTDNFSVYDIVADLRRQRMAMVQTKVFCMLSVQQDFAMQVYKTIPCALIS